MKLKLLITAALLATGPVIAQPGGPLFCTGSLCEATVSGDRYVWGSYGYIVITGMCPETSDTCTYGCPWDLAHGYMTLEVYDANDDLIASGSKRACPDL
jgi:hypothetical protein